MSLPCMVQWVCVIVQQDRMPRLVQCMACDHGQDLLFEFALELLYSIYTSVRSNNLAVELASMLCAESA